MIRFNLFYFFTYLGDLTMQYITEQRYLSSIGHQYRIVKIDYSPYLEKDISEHEAIEQALEIFARLQDDFISW